MKAQQTKWTGRVFVSAGVKKLNLSAATEKAAALDLFAQLREADGKGGKVFYGTQMLINGQLPPMGSIAVLEGGSEIITLVGCIYLAAHGKMQKGDYCLCLVEEWDHEKLPL